MLALEAERLAQLEALEALLSRQSSNMSETLDHSNHSESNQSTIETELNELESQHRTQLDLALSLKMTGIGMKMFEQSARVFQDVKNPSQHLAPNQILPNIYDLISESHARVHSLSSRTLLLSPSLIEQVMQLLKELHVPILTSPHEGEALCAYLTASGQTYASATEDMDCCVFGDGLVIRHLAKAVVFTSRTPNPFEGELESLDDSSTDASSISSSFLQHHRQQQQQQAIAADSEAFKTLSAQTESKSLIQINPLEFRLQTGLTHAQFVDVMILCGCDFSDGLKGVGHVNAFKLVKQYGSIEAILESNKFVPKEGFDYLKARRVFLEGPKEMEGVIVKQEVEEAIQHFRGMHGIQ
ncbi:PIN domain-like protein [Rhizoclosmatium globosum]|uniref:PIN domain-like protein n=1 Tax=Rhizoclosmatium globosum TaxID=329046 RepID=A0A1Y2CE92_9FUNG|nr:PIN domain-like protein [Rhizoclosmatium globosum]|eukprot:ORY45246.1 PIN domain-like protein [Rhizoclosmatium globosum]